MVKKHPEVVSESIFSALIVQRLTLQDVVANQQLGLMLTRPMMTVQSWKDNVQDRTMNQYSSVKIGIE